MNRHLVCGLCLLLGAAPAVAKVTPNALVSDHMVLQRGGPVTVWGTADAGQKVTVAYSGPSADGKEGVTAEATAGEDGKWSAELPALKVGGPYQLVVTGAGEQPLVFDDVLVGEVWVCSGQSNMQWSLNNTAEGEQAIAEAQNPNLRLFYVPRKPADQPQETIDASWTQTTPETAAGFSAVAYHFGNKLQQDLEVPVGLVHTSWGGTRAEAWTRRQALEDTDALDPLMARVADEEANRPQREIANQQKMAEHRKAVEQAKENDQPAPKRPDLAYVELPQHRAGHLYNGMVAPLLPYRIAGAIWYQGESNAGRAYEYRTLMKTLIGNWREDFGQGDFPFLIVQLAPWRQISPGPNDSQWAELRQAQIEAEELPKVQTVSIADLGDQNDIHPRRKQPVGERLARAALFHAYGKDVNHGGPRAAGFVVNADGSATVQFESVDDGLRVRKQADEVPFGGDTVTGFEVAGADGRFVAADAKVTGKDAVTLTAEGIDQPTAVRYGWDDYPLINLFDSEGLPASPFRIGIDTTFEDAWTTKPASQARPELRKAG